MGMLQIYLMKENSYMLKKVRRTRYPAQTIKAVDYADGIALLANTPTQAKSLLSVEQTAGSIGLLVNVDETE